MQTFEILYLCFGTYIVAAGITMIATYSLTNPWWKTTLGRMMITYAAAETVMSLILLLAVVGHMNPTWFRWAWFALQIIVGTTLWFQTYMLILLHRRTRRETRRVSRQ